MSQEQPTGTAHAPVSPDRVSAARRSRGTFAAIGVVLLATIWVGTGAARASWEQIAHFLSLQGEPEPASADGSLDAETHKWIFQALRDITGQTLPHDLAAWRHWYDSQR